MRTCSNRLGDIAGKSYSPIGDHRDKGTVERLGNIGNCGHLRNADSSDNPSCADGSRANANLNGIRTRVGQCSGSICSCNIAGDNIYRGEHLLNLSDPAQHATRMPVRSVDNNRIHTGVHQAFAPLRRIPTCTYRSGYAQPPKLIFTGLGKLGLLLDIHNRNQPFEVEVLINQQYFFNTVLVQ